ncbi:MAG TPA: hypothetical protein PKI11_19765 [Candidatus Hydrogenedentes bacterium]|nr:hypothetical protein [Candidatus Hydrogenedentota bacterium]HNT89124.1 hypothetical protein [Candidatus Hydrogenedentota bacterium]
MTCRGHVKDGVVVLDEPALMPDGALVEIRVVDADIETDEDNDVAALQRDLLEFAGKFTGLPEDAARNVDHYLYGHPKR